MNVSRLKELRAEQGLSQFKLAVKVGTTEKSISFYEQGRREPSIKALKAIAAALGVHPGELI